MAKITTTLSVKDNATKAIVNLKKQMQEYQHGHLEAVKALDSQNKEIVSSETKLNSQIKTLQAEKKKTLLEISTAQASMTKKQLASRKKEIESIKESGKEKEKLLGKDTRYTRAYYDNQIALAKENLEKQKKINNTKLAEAKRNVDLQKDQIVDIEKQTQQEVQVSAAREDYRRTYENTKATNAYNDAIKKLNHQKEIGAITSKQYEAALKKEKKNLKEAELASKRASKAQKSLTNDLIRHLRQIETAVIAYYALSRAFKATIGVGLEVNEMIESNTYGIAALLSANTQMILSNGQVVTSYEKFKIGQEIATKTMEDLRKASVKTYATFPQLTEIYQQAIGQTLSMGDAFGSTVDEITTNTIKLSQRMSNIGGAIGMPMDRIREEIRSLLSGNASTDSLISTMIFGSPGEANKAVRMAKQRGTDGVTQMLDSVLAPFDMLENVDSYTRSLLSLEDAWSQTMRSMSKPIFEDLKITFKELANDINENSDEIASSFKVIYEGAKDLVGVIDDVAVAATAFYGAKAVSSVYAMVKAQKALNLAILANPYIIAATVAVGAYEATQNWRALGDTLIDVADIASISDEAFGTKLGENVDYNRKRFEDFKDSVVDADEVLKEFGGTIEEAIYKPFDLGFKTEDFNKALADAKSAIESVKKDLETAAISGSKEEIANLQKQYKSLAESIVSMMKDNMGKGKLQTLIPVDTKFLEKAQKQINKELDETVKLEQEIIKANNEIEQYEKRVASAKRSGETDVESVKNIATLKEKIRSDTAEISKIELDAYVKKLVSENDLWVAKQRVLGVEVKKSDMIMDTISMNAIKLTNVTDEVELNEKQAEIYKLILDYNKSINKEGEDRLKKQKEYWDNILEARMESYDSDIKRLDIQKELTSSTLEWQNNLKGAAGAIAGISTALVKVQTTYLDYKKSKIELDKQRTKDLSKHKKYTIGYYDVERKYEEYNAKLKEQNTAREISAYSQLAGAASQMFEEGSKEAAAMQAVSAALALTNAVAAVMAGGKTATAYEVIPSMLAVAATATSFLGSIGVALGGGKGSTVPSAAETSATYKEQVDLTNKPILDRLDRQIELLEALGGYSGTVVGAQLELAQSTYTKDLQTIDADILATMRDRIAAGWGKTMANNPDFSLYDYLTVDTKEGYKLLGRTLDDYLISAGITADEWAAIESDMQQATHDYTMSLLEQVEALSNTADSFEEAYDSLTGTDYYKDLNLEQAQEEVDALLSGTGLSLEDYLKEQIGLIDELESSLSSEDIALLLSDDIDNLEAQQALLDTLAKETQDALDAGALAALNSKDAILLVADAMSEVETASTDAYRSVYDAVNNIFSSLDDALTPTSLEGFNATLEELKNFQGTETELEDILDELSRQSDALFDTSNFQTKAEMEYQQALTKNQLDDIAEPLKEEIDFLEEINDTLVDIKSVLEDDSDVNILTDETGIAEAVEAIEVPPSTTWYVPPSMTLEEYEEFNANGGTIAPPPNGFASGGYTGNGGVNDIAGVVHGQEYVVNAQTTKDLGLNNGNGGVFKELASEMKKLREENSDMKKLLVKMTANSTKQLNTQRAIESNTFAQAS